MKNSSRQILIPLNKVVHLLKEISFNVITTSVIDTVQDPVGTLL